MRFALVIGGWVLVTLIGVSAHGQTPRIPGIAEVATVAKGLENPWGFAFLPDGRMLVTERPGRLRIVARDGRLSEPLTGVPQVVARGQGGLLDSAVLDGGVQSGYDFKYGRGTVNLGSGMRTDVMFYSSGNNCTSSRN